MTRNMQEAMNREAIRRLAREKRMLAVQKEALILLSLALAMVLGLILISI